jgi:cytochrome P450
MGECFQHDNYYIASYIFLDSPSDFIDSYLAKIEDSTPDSSFHATLGFQNLRSSILDLLIAGSDTTSTVLTWAILYMIRYPHIQKQVQQEIDQVIGGSRLPKVSDR